MGHAMASRLLGAGHDVMVYNRSEGKLSDLVASGAIRANSIAEAAAYSGVTLTMLADDGALTAVTTGAGALLESLPVGGIHVAMGTHDVRTIRSLASAHSKAGQTLLSAPVLGRPDAVAAGRLAVVVAGESAAVERARPVLEALGRRVFFAGEEPGAASAMKLANNFLLACAIEALGEAFSLVQKSGVDPKAFLELVTDGLFSCPAYNTYAKIIAEKSWDNVGFTVALALKDINLALAAGNLAGVPLPSANVCRDRLLSAISHGGEGLDWAAMALEQARASGM
jgi:3-hydroxyisobutyrate dehydrogenase-like beta-hydroxyacid dehydrogenase